MELEYGLVENALDSLREAMNYYLKKYLEEIIRHCYLKILIL